MIVITRVAYETASPKNRALILSATWLDGLRFDYVINRHGITIQGINGKVPRRSALMIHCFAVAVHDDVWSLLLQQRFDPLIKTVEGIRHLFFKRESQFFQSEDIGIAFGVGNPREVAEFLRSMGYRVKEVRWVDMLRAGALQTAE